MYKISTLNKISPVGLARLNDKVINFGNCHYLPSSANQIFDEGYSALNLVPKVWNLIIVPPL